jgi:hypothetical protein
MKETAQGWVDLAILDNLPCRNLWFLANWQFVPKVFSGIGLNSAPYSVLAECVMKQHHALVPLGVSIGRITEWCGNLTEDFLA